MITEHASSVLRHHMAALPGPHMAMIVESTLAGNTLAQCWTLSEETAEPVVVLWEKGNNGLYLSRLPSEPALNDDLSQLINTTIRLRALDEGRRFKVRVLAAHTDEALHALFVPTPLRRYQTRFYGFTQTLPDQQLPSKQAGIRFAPIERALLEQETLVHREELVDEISGMWPSEQRFYSDGFGYVAIVDDQIVCWCTAEFVGPARCGIGIATQPSYQRQGIATATATRVVAQALQRGLTPYWECGSTNLASQRVAEKVGFDLLDEEPFWIGFAQ